MMKAIFIFVLFVTFSFVNIQEAKAAVPTFDVGLNPLLTTTQATIIANQEVQITELAAIASGEAGQYQKEIGIPPPLLLPYLSPTIGASALTCANLDCFAWIVAKTVVHNLSQQIISWIRTGNWGGGPLFVTDWESFLLSAVDQASGLFLQELQLTQLCQPFSLPIRQGLSNSIIGNGGRGIPFNMRARCTISGVLNNLQNFYKNFSSGGWDMWMQVSQEPQNNPYMAFLMGIEALENRRQIATQKNFFEALASQGLLGQKNCRPATIETEPGDTPLGQICDIVTPGKAVEEELAKVLGTNIDQLNLADEIDEILMAILQTLLQKIMTGAQGLLSEDITNTPAPIPTPLNIPSGGPVPTAVTLPGTTPTPVVSPTPTLQPGASTVALTCIGSTPSALISWIGEAFAPNYDVALAITKQSDNQSVFNQNIWVNYVPGTIGSFVWTGGAVNIAYSYVLSNAFLGVTVGSGSFTTPACP